HDAQTGQYLVSLGRTRYLSDTASIIYLAWSPTSTRIASRLSDKSIELWDVETEQLLGERSGSEDYYFICNMAWIPESKLLAYGEPERPTAALGKNPVLAFAPHAPLLAAIDEDNQRVHILEINLATLLRTKVEPPHKNVKDVPLGKSNAAFVLTNLNEDVTCS